MRGFISSSLETVGAGVSWVPAAPEDSIGCAGVEPSRRPPRANSTPKNNTTTRETMKKRCCEIRWNSPPGGGPTGGGPTGAGRCPGSEVSLGVMEIQAPNVNLQLIIEGDDRQKSPP